MMLQKQPLKLATLRSSSLSTFLSTSTCSTLPSTTTTKEIRPPQAYVSTSQDPWFNLSLEHFLFTNVDSEVPVCLLYRNRPCVVIGRNQNPWKELNASSMREKGIPFVRRRSGGGTVFHDLGNTNYSFHTSRNAFKRETHSTLVVKALNELLFPAQTSKTGDKPSSSEHGELHASGTYVNSRNDICVKVALPPEINASSSGSDPSAAFQELKISGSAYKLISSRAYHHGTMLLNASLDSLGKVLSNDRVGLTSKGVESFRSPVINLGQFFRKGKIDHDKFTEVVVDQFQATYGETEVMEVGEEIFNEKQNQLFGGKGIEEFRKGYRELKSWDWNFGGSPEFFNVLNSRRATVQPTSSQETNPRSSRTPVEGEAFSISDLSHSEQKRVSLSFDQSNLLQTRSYPLRWGEFSLKVKSRNGLIESIELFPRISLENLDSRDVSVASLGPNSPDARSQVTIDPSHRSNLLSILSHFEGKRYDDFGLRSLSGVDFELDSKEVDNEKQRRRSWFRKEVLAGGGDANKERDDKIREEILDDLLRWFEEAL